MFRRKTTPSRTHENQGSDTFGVNRTKFHALPLHFAPPRAYPLSLPRVTTFTPHHPLHFHCPDSIFLAKKRTEQVLAAGNSASHLVLLCFYFFFRN